MNAKLKITGYALTGTVLAGLFARMLYKVIEGNGGEIITSMKGVKYTPIALVIFVLSIPLFIALARLTTWYLERDERAFKQYIRKNVRKCKNQNIPI